ncbi:hypothetical protein QDY64_22080 [Klebsiella quasipneumoniae]|uniref:hypothetical protein n=1 Tax=Klebsiella quasipneumoniae TaxID=1463165 RepID=UPI00244A14DB|nr:hypothetical protein [Klebsiella quasipneumoniae]MDH2712066.1 hypothetical protein [Klebsiella quasipneumoniae]
MTNLMFLSDYMQEFSEDYILIGGNACALHFESLGANFRATVDLDVVLIVEGESEGFFKHLNDYLLQHNYVGKSYKGSNQGGSAYRFTLPEEDRTSGCPVQIELFSRKPDYYDVSKCRPGKEHIVPIETADGISNFSAILLDDSVYDFIKSSRINLKGVSTVTLECLLGLKSVAWHSNQDLFDNGKIKQYETVLKHPADMINIVSVIDPTESIYPEIIFDSLQVSYSKFLSGELTQHIPIERELMNTAADFINNYVKKQIF